MSIDEDKALIKKLIPYYRDANFNERFEHVTRDLSKSRRFLVKMEINRLFNDCPRNIDLRGRVDGQCVEHPYADLVHYLDDVALNTFEEALSVYGKFTMGVYEEVTNAKNSYREKQLKEDEARRNELKNQSLAKAKKRTIETDSEEKEKNIVIPPHFAKKISLTDLNQRFEERVNILTRVKVRLANGRTVHGLTSNMSTRGAKIKLTNAYKIAIGDTLYIEYVEIEQPPEEAISLELAYKVLDANSQSDQHWINLHRVHQQVEVDNVLTKFIKKERSSNSTDVEHIIEAVRSLGYQYIHLNKMVGLPLFFERQDEKLHPLFALSNFENKNILNYWRTHNNILRISALVSHQRLSDLLALNHPEKPTLIFCFTHIARGRKYFYSATEHELMASGLTDLFFQFGAGKDSWKVYQLYVTDINNYEWHMPEVLPQHLVLKEKSTLEQHKHLLKLHDLETMAYLHDITNCHDFKHYRMRQPADPRINQLQRFGHKEVKENGIKLIETNVMTMSNRREDRFTYQTKAAIVQKRKRVEGITVDFSVHGVQINLREPIEARKGDIIDVSIPLFNKAAKQPEDAVLHYEIMRVAKDKKILNLKIHMTPETEHGPKGIYRIIKGNQHKLTAQIAPPANFTKSLIFMYCHYISSLVIMISKVKNHYTISQVIKPGQHNPLYNLFSVLSPIDNHCDMSSLSQNNLFKELFTDTLMQLTPTSPAASKEVYIQLIHEGESTNYRTLTHLFEELETAQEHCDFIENAEKEGQLFALRITMGRTPSMNYKAFSREIIYAAKQTSYKTRQLQAELDGVIGTAEIVDIMAEVKQRFNCH